MAGFKEAMMLVNSITWRTGSISLRPITNGVGTGAELIFSRNNKILAVEYVSKETAKKLVDEIF